MTWSRQQYEDRIRGHAGDLGLLQHLEDTQITTALERALATFTNDKPRTAAQTFSGDNTTQTFDLTAAADWTAGWSQVASVEHPTGEIPKKFIDAHKWTHDTDTDDLLIHDAPEAGTDNIKVRFTALWAHPDDDPSDDTNPIPEIYAQAIAELAAHHVIHAKATEFARQHSQSVAGNLYTRDAAPLFEAARNLKKAYEETVLGRPAGAGTASQIGLAVTDVDVFPDALLHTRDEVIAEEEAYSG